MTLIERITGVFGGAGNPAGKNPAGSLPDDVHELPRVVIGPADLDNLELALTGAIPAGVGLAASTNAIENAQRILITDEENTPLALFDSPIPADVPESIRSGNLHPLRALPTRVGAASEADLRMSPERARSAISKRRPRGDVVAVAFTELPTREDLHRVSDQLERRNPQTILWTAVASRTRAPEARGSRTRASQTSAFQTPSDNALVRAVMALKPSGAVGLVVPALHAEAEILRPLARQTDLDGSSHSAKPALPAALSLSATLAQYGAGETLDVIADRTASELERLRGLDDHQVDIVYPLESTRELGRPADRVRGRGMGAVILLTGLSGSGKSTVAQALTDRLETETAQAVTLLDGDQVRQMLSSELGFDRRSRELNLQRIGYVAGLVSRSGGIAIAAPIAPFESSRQEMRRLAEENGAFLLVHVSTPLEVCESRDRKGLYAAARAGRIEEFTGISSPYEAPEDADVVIDTSVLTVDESVDAIVAALAGRLSFAALTA